MGSMEMDENYRVWKLTAKFFFILKTDYNLDDKSYLFSELEEQLLQDDE
jgi:hypothetical protein